MLCGSDTLITWGWLKKKIITYHSSTLQGYPRNIYCSPSGENNLVAGCERVKQRQRGDWHSYYEAGSLKVAGLQSATTVRHVGGTTFMDDR